MKTTKAKKSEAPAGASKVVTPEYKAAQEQKNEDARALLDVVAEAAPLRRGAAIRVARKAAELSHEDEAES
jgi:hypothetical protein